MVEWKSYNFAEVIDFREGPGIMAADFQLEGVPLIRLAGLDADRSILNKCNYLDPGKVEEKWSHFRLEPGDVLLSTSASLGRVRVVSEEGSGAVPYTGIIRMRPKSECLRADFIPWLLRSDDFARQVEMAGVGSVMAHFGPSHLRKMMVRLPPFREQSRIAAILGAFDRLIETERRQAKLLNDLWRVRVRLEVGEGSEPIPLTDLATFANGKNFTRGATGTGLPVIRTPEVRSGPTASTVHNDVDAADENVAEAGDLLFVWSGSLMAARWKWERGLINQHIFKVLPLEGVPAWLPMFAIEDLMQQFLDIAADKATTMGHIRRSDLHRIVTVPTRDAWDALDESIRPLWDEALAAEVQASSLTRVRDELLRLLMSGRVHVADMEGVV